MSRQAAYEAVYNQIIAEMEKGNIPWKKGWVGATPKNGSSGHKYAGINFFLLATSGFADPRWYTFNQAKTLGGQIKPGSKGRQIVFWKMFETEDKAGKKQNIPLLRYSTVFNFEQCEGLKAKELEEIVLVDAESIIKNFIGCPKITYGHDKACYIPSLDEVRMPSKHQYAKIENYYSNIYHEIAHSCLHEKRLNRPLCTDFGSNIYSENELEAELVSAFLCNAAGIDNTVENSAAYIKGWMKAFKDNPAMITTAASKAQKVANYILGIE